MESQTNLFVNEQAKSNSNNTSIPMNDQHLDDAVSSNVESRFSLGANFAIDSLLINELIDVHKKRTSKQMKYAMLVFGIIGLIGLGLIIAYLTMPKCINDINECPSTGIPFVAIGSTFLALAILFCLITGCCVRYKFNQQSNDLCEAKNGQHLIVWRLDGDEWIRYLNYIYGPNREWTESAPLSCFCCRRSDYERLMDRQYGNIILYNNGFLIDELFFISFRTYTLQGIQLLTVDQHEHIRGLRIHTYIKAGQNSRNLYFDLFAPSSISMEQLQTIARSYSGNISGFNGYGMAMQGL